MLSLFHANMDEYKQKMASITQQPYQREKYFIKDSFRPSCIEEYRDILNNNIYEGFLTYQPFRSASHKKPATFKHLSIVIPEDEPEE